MTQIDTGSALVLSPLTATAQQVAALAKPQTVQDVLGAATSEDIIAVMRQTVRDNLVQSRNEISARLVVVEKNIGELRETYDKIGPSLIGEVDTTVAQDIAALLLKGGFGKAKVEVAFDSRDEEKKVYAFTIKIIDPEETSTYSRNYVTKSVTLPFTAEAKKLNKQIIELLKKKQGIEKELMQVKRDMANIEEHVAAARAEMGRRRINALSGGQELLAQLTRKKPVVND
jgi:hypothetical protein